MTRFDRDPHDAETRSDDRRILLAVLVCTALVIGWYLVAHVGVLDDVMPEYSSQWRDF